MHSYRMRPKVLQNRLQRIRMGLIAVCALSIAVALIVGGLWLWKMLVSGERFLITSARVSAHFDHLSTKQIDALVLKRVHGNFFLFNANALSHALYQLPWVDEVSVRRIWPHTVAVSIKERRAVAQWQAGSLIDQNGDIFTPDKKTFPKNLVGLNGPTGQQALLWQQSQYFNQLLAPLHLWVVELDLSARQAWRAKLNNGVWVILGSRDWKNNFIQFITNYPQVIEGKVNNISYVDMRYPNGFAIGKY